MRFFVREKKKKNFFIPLPSPSALELKIVFVKMPWWGFAEALGLNVVFMEVFGALSLRGNLNRLVIPPRVRRRREKQWKAATKAICSLQYSKLNISLPWWEWEESLAFFFSALINCQSKSFPHSDGRGKINRTIIIFACAVISKQFDFNRKALCPPPGASLQ